jgi:hypothetical protein
MATLTSRGWRRGEPGLITVLEQPSMLPRAVELLAAEGIAESQLRDQCRVPADLFGTVTSRTPDPAAQEADADPAPPFRVTSLFR